MTNRVCFIAAALFLNAALPAGAQEPARNTIWDLRLGAGLSAQPAPGGFRAYACGANGGPPRRPLADFSGFAQCAPEPDGLREVAFEYDDELEYIARARDLAERIGPLAGTGESGYFIVASALFDAAGALRGIRLVTDPRPDYRRDASDAKGRARAHQFGGVMAARFGMEPSRDCQSLPPAPGESPVGGLFIKLDCEKTNAAEKRRYVLSARLLRKPGQAGRDPQNPGQLTAGQFESSARLEIYALP